MSELSVALEKMWAELRLTTLGYTVMKKPLGVGHWKNAETIYRDKVLPLLLAPHSWEPRAPQGALAVVDGRGTSKAGVYVDAASSPSAEQGREIKGFNIRNFLEEGLGFMYWRSDQHPPVRNSVGRYDVHDFICENIGSGGTKGGTTEFCLRVGQTANVYNFVLKNPGWCALWVGARSVDSYIHDFVVEALGHAGGGGKVGIYGEHAHQGTILAYGKVHSTGTCINEEWWYTEDDYASFMSLEAKANLPGRAGPSGGEIAHMILQSDEEYGINLGPGVYGKYIHDVTFVGCPKGAISHPKRLADPSRPNFINWASCNFVDCVGPMEVQHDLPIGVTQADHHRRVVEHLDSIESTY